MSQPMKRVLEELQHLSSEERRQLLEVLRAAPPTRMPPSEIVDRVHGKYARVRTSSEDYCGRKTEEIALEGRRQ